MPGKRKEKFQQSVVDDVAKRLGELAASVELAQASLEQPADGMDAEDMLTMLDELRIKAKQLFDTWRDEQYAVFPETQG